MDILFKNKSYFLVLFLIILFTDVFVKLNLDSLPYRYFSKPLIVISLFLFYYFNGNKSNTIKHRYVVLGLLCFLIGDILFINGDEQVYFLSAMLLFSIGKIFYSAKFSNSKDFATSKLIPFLAISFIYMFGLFKVIYEGLRNLFIPVLFYFFVTLVMAQMIFLRKNSVINKSYLYAMAGVIVLLLGETITAVKTFRADIPFQDFFNMFFYGLSQYLIISSIVIENETNILPKVSKIKNSSSL